MMMKNTIKENIKALSLRGASRRSNLIICAWAKLDCFALLAMTVVIVFSVATTVFAEWTSPAASAPGGGVDMPVNISEGVQMKKGGLVVGGSFSPDSVAPSFYIKGGKFGIGVLLPEEKMEVAGKVRATDFCTSGNPRVCLSDAGAAGSLSGGNANALAKWIGRSSLGNTAVYSLPSGLVGIGTSLPSAFLHIDDSSDAPIIRPLLRINEPRESSTTALHILTKDYPFNIDVYSNETSSGIRPAFTVSSLGKVGIGDSDPKTTLAVNGVAGFDKVNLGDRLQLTTFGNPTNVADDVNRWLRLTNLSGNQGGLSAPKLYVGTTSQPIFTATFAGKAEFGADATFETGFTFGGVRRTTWPSFNPPAAIKRISTTTGSGIVLTPGVGEGENMISLDFTDVQKAEDFICPEGMAIQTLRPEGGDVLTDCVVVNTNSEQYSSSTDGGVVNVVKKGLTGTGDVGYLPKFITSNSINNSVVYQNDDGNIGMGTEEPVAKFDVRSNSRQPVLKVSNNDSTGVLVSNSAVSGRSLVAYSSGVGGTAGRFLSTGGGYALKADGMIKLAGPVGIGAEPLSADNGGNPLGSVSLRVDGRIGADAYCDIDGRVCINVGTAVLAVERGFWDYVSGSTDNIHHLNLGGVVIGTKKNEFEGSKLFVDNVSTEENTGAVFRTAGERGSAVYGLARGENGYGVVGETAKENSFALSSMSTGEQGTAVYANTTGLSSTAVSARTDKDGSDSMVIDALGSNNTAVRATASGPDSNAISAVSSSDVGVLSEGGLAGIYGLGTGGIGIGGKFVTERDDTVAVDVVGKMRVGAWLGETAADLEIVRAATTTTTTTTGGGVTATTTTTAITTTTIKAPTGLTVSVQSCQRTGATAVISITWNSVAGAASYFVQRQTAGGAGGWQDVGAVTGNSTTNTIAQIGDWQYRVKAIDTKDVSSVYSGPSLTINGMSCLMMPGASSDDGSATGWLSKTLGSLFGGKSLVAAMIQATSTGGGVTPPATSTSTTHVVNLTGVSSGYVLAAEDSEGTGVWAPLRYQADGCSIYENTITCGAGGGVIMDYPNSALGTPPAFLSMDASRAPLSGSTQVAGMISIVGGVSTYPPGSYITGTQSGDKCPPDVKKLLIPKASSCPAGQKGFAICSSGKLVWHKSSDNFDALGTERGNEFYGMVAAAPYDFDYNKRAGAGGSGLLIFGSSIPTGNTTRLTGSYNDSDYSNDCTKSGCPFLDSYWTNKMISFLEKLSGTTMSDAQLKAKSLPTKSEQSTWTIDDWLNSRDRMYENGESYTAKIWRSCGTGWRPEPFYKLSWNPNNGGTAWWNGSDSFENNILTDGYDNIYFIRDYDTALAYSGLTEIQVSTDGGHSWNRRTPPAKGSSSYVSGCYNSDGAPYNVNTIADITNIECGTITTRFGAAYAFHRGEITYGGLNEGGTRMFRLGGLGFNQGINYRAIIEKNGVIVPTPPDLVEQPANIMASNRGSGRIGHEVINDPLNPSHDIDDVTFISGCKNLPCTSANSYYYGFKLFDVTNSKPPLSEEIHTFSSASALGCGHAIPNTSTSLQGANEFVVSPEGRKMAYVYDGEYIGYYSGAGGPTGDSNDVWSSADATHWVRNIDHAMWSPRHGMAAASYRGLLWMVGGAHYVLPDQITKTNGHIEYYSDVWYSLDGIMWIPVGSAPWAAREKHKLFVYGGRMWIAGGGEREWIIE